MAAPIVYRWDDGNAPVARGERRSLCDILYACLVTGYGEKPGAGWTREYVNETFDKAVFRNNPATGTGFYLQVDGAGAANAHTPNVRAFEAMTSIDEGAFPFTASALTAYTSSAAGTTARPWILIADDRAFYFVCWGSNTIGQTLSLTYAFGFFFGDMIARKPDDAFCCAIQVGDSVARSNFITHVSDQTTIHSYGWIFPRKMDGVAGVPYYAAQVAGGGPGTHTSTPMGYTGMSYTPGDAIYIARPFVNDGAGYTYRGHAPGLYRPCHALAFGQLEQLNVDGGNFLSLRLGNYQSGGGNIFISLDDWRA